MIQDLADVLRDLTERPGESHLSDEPSLTVNELKLSLAQLADILAIAEMRGVELQVAIEDFLWQAEFGRIAALMEEEFPQEYTGARRLIEQGGPYIAFRGEVPDEAHRVASASSRFIQLIGNRGFSQAQILEKLQSVFQAVARDEAVANAAGSPDDSVGSITIQVEPVGQLSARDEQELKELVRQPAGSEITVQLEIVAKVDSYVPEIDVRGGSYFHGSASTGSGHKCTTGYTVRQGSTGREGVATAGHCATLGSRFYANHSFNDGWKLLPVEGIPHQGNSGDISWYRVSAPDRRLPHFFSHWGITRNVGPVNGSPQVGDNLCKFGIVSGHSCATVTDINECITSSTGAFVCNLTRTTAATSSNGDSGGPWFAGTTPYGIHAGSLPSGLVFTPVGRLSNQFGVTLIR